MSWQHERARIASLTRSRDDNDPELIAARRNLKSERLADYIKRVVDEAPPLTAAQRDKLALLLRGKEPPPTAQGESIRAINPVSGSPRHIHRQGGPA